MKKLLLASTALALLAGSASAQVANISQTDLTPAGFNTTTGMQINPSPTYVPNDGETLLAVRTGASTANATIRTQATTMSQAGYGTVALSDLVVAVPANTTMLLGPFPTGRWNNTAFGTMKVDFSVPVSVTSVRAPI